MAKTASRTDPKTRPEPKKTAKKGTRRTTKPAAQVTLRDLSQDRSLEFYLRDISRNSTLSREEEVALAGRIQSGDKRALESLVKANLRFVICVARNYQHQGLPLSDLINEGNIGLIKAAQRFDGNKNFKFISYAVWWIRQSILQALANQSRITKLPLNRAGMLYKIDRVRSKLEQQIMRNPDVSEIAEKMRVEKGVVHDTMKVANGHTSLDAPIPNRAASPLMDTLRSSTEDAPDTRIMQVSLREEVNAVLEYLTPKEREVIRFYFGLDDQAPLTLDQIGQRLHITRERVRQIKMHAMSKLRNQSQVRKLNVYHSAA